MRGRESERESERVQEPLSPPLPHSFAVVHLAGVQPVLQRLRPPEARDDQVVEGVLARQGQQGAAHPHAQEHKKAGEVLDPHLQRLRGTTGRQRRIS